MSLQLSQPLVEDLRSQRPTCRRGEGFADTVEVVDDGSLRGRAVPYGSTVQLADGLFERFMPGAFGRQERDPARVKVCLDHGQVVGKVVGLVDQPDGLHFDARISGSDDIPEARKARAMLADGLADELSVGFRTLPGGSDVEERSDGAVLWTHRKAQLVEISLVPWGVYGREATVTRSMLVDLEDEQRRLQRELAVEQARGWLLTFVAAAR